jgi:DNA-binding IclR family transcriptional regulator
VSKQLGIIPITKPVLNDLAERIGEVAWLLFEEHSHPIYIDKSVGSRGIITFRQEGSRPSVTSGKSSVDIKREKVRLLMNYAGRTAD